MRPVRRNTGKIHDRHVGAVVGYKPPRDRSVLWRKVPCRRCKAEVGEMCLLLDGSGKDAKSVHPVRRGDAIKAGF